MRTGVALGSNVGDRFHALCNALEALRRLPHAGGPFLCSNLYETEPVDSKPDTHPFLNAVVEFDYTAEPATLLESLQRIEFEMGRPSQRPRNAPRTIDLDILYIADLHLSTATLSVPHPRLHLRRFVLAPLADIRPDLRLPNQTSTVTELLRDLKDPASVQRNSLQWNTLP